MLIESLVERIACSIDQLGRMLDQLHKLPSSLREKYLMAISKLKDKLLLLKAHTRQGNYTETEKQFQQACLQIHALKEDLATQLLPISHSRNNKENREPNRPRQTRKDHQDAMRIIVQRDEQIAQLKQELFEKEELVRVTFQDLHRHRKELEQMTDQYRITKAALSQLEIEYSSLKAVFLKTEETKIDLQLHHQQRERDFRQTTVEIQELMHQLHEARERIGYFQQLAQVSMGKTRQVQENIRMVEQEASMLNENYLRREEEGLRLHKQIEHLTITLSSKDGVILQQEEEISRLRQEVELLVFEINKIENFMQQERGITYQERTKHQAEIERLQHTILSLRGAQEEIMAELSQLRTSAESSEQISQQKSKEARSLSAQLEECREKMEDYLLMTLDLQAKLETSHGELQSLKKERQMQGEQFEKAQQLSRELQNDIRLWKDRLRTKEEEKVKAVLQAQKCQRDMKSMQRERDNAINQMEACQRQVRESKTSIIHLQEQLKQKDRDLTTIKGRLLRAKIEIIHEMRQQMG